MGQKGGKPRGDITVNEGSNAKRLTLAERSLGKDKSVSDGLIHISHLVRFLPVFLG